MTGITGDSQSQIFKFKANADASPMYCARLQEVCGWINAKASVPVWAKMTPNITDITAPARTALMAGCEGVAAINTITSVMGINLDTLRPEPSVEGYSTPGGYSSKAVKPIALAKVGFCVLLYMSSPIENWGRCKHILELGRIANPKMDLSRMLWAAVDLCLQMKAFVWRHAGTAHQLLGWHPMPLKFI